MSLLPPLAFLALAFAAKVPGGTPGLLAGPVDDEGGGVSFTVAGGAGAGVGGGADLSGRDCANTIPAWTTSPLPACCSSFRAAASRDEEPDSEPTA